MTNLKAILAITTVFILGTLNADAASKEEMLESGKAYACHAPVKNVTIHVKFRTVDGFMRFFDDNGSIEMEETSVGYTGAKGNTKFLREITINDLAIWESLYWESNSPTTLVMFPLDQCVEI